MDIATYLLIASFGFTIGVCVERWLNFRASIPMILYCPNCERQHIDRVTPEWNNPPHRSHKCEYCGCIWRPADVRTEGVEEITTKGKADTWV